MEFERGSDSRSSAVFEVFSFVGHMEAAPFERNGSLSAIDRPALTT